MGERVGRDAEALRGETCLVIPMLYLIWLRVASRTLVKQLKGMEVGGLMDERTSARCFSVSSID